MTLTSEVIDSYKLYLEIKRPAHWKKYCDLLKSNRQGAKAEAVVFQFLRSVFEDVTVAEDISTGGADFLCKAGGIELIAEATSLEAESVARQSGWENTIPEDGTAGWFQMITHKVRTKAGKKAPQLSGRAIPSILVITCEHVASDVLMGPHGAEVFLTGEPRIEVPVGKPADHVASVTDLKNSLFFDVKNGRVEPGRRSISAVLLVSIFSHESSVLGILHPDPQFPFPMSLLPSVPFLRMKKGPPRDQVIETEWVIQRPAPWKYYHYPVQLRDEELKNT